MTLEASVHAFRLRVIARAQALGNVSQACREFGISRTLVYRWRRRYLAYAPDGVYPGGVDPDAPGPGAETQRAIPALAWPTLGPARLAAQLARPQYGSRRLAQPRSIGSCAGWATRPATGGWG